MKKFFKLAFINLILLVVVLFLAELVVWRMYNNKLAYDNLFPKDVKQINFHEGIKKFNLDLDYFGASDDNWGRPPVGINFKKKKPIVIFGCSFAYGLNLENEQTFSYKLSKLTKRPVYNRSWMGWGIQHMLYQAKQDKFYEKNPEPEYVIYVYINDHLRRLYLLTFSEWNMLAEEFYLRYKLKDGKLVEILNRNNFLNQIKRIYMVNRLHNLYVWNYILKDREKCYDFALKHFIEAKEEMQQHWKKTKFAVLFFDEKSGFYDKDEQIHNLAKADFKQKLQDNGFIILNANELTNEDLKADKYNQKDNHPTEEVWNLLTPLVVKKLKL